MKNGNGSKKETYQKWNKKRGEQKENEKQRSENEKQRNWKLPYHLRGWNNAP